VRLWSYGVMGYRIRLWMNLHFLEMDSSNSNNACLRLSLCWVN